MAGEKIQSNRKAQQYGGALESSAETMDGALMSYHLVTEPAQLEAVRQRLAAEPVIGLAAEVTSLDPFTGQIRFLQLATSAGVTILDLAKLGPNSIELLRQMLEADRPVKIVHDGKLEAKMLLHHFGIEIGRVFDTLLASQLVAAGDSTKRHDFPDLARALLGVQVGERPRVIDRSRELSPRQLTDLSRSVELLLPVRLALIEKLKQARLIDVAKLEFECVIPTAAMELAGMYLDRDRWRDLVAELERKHDTSEEELRGELAGVSDQVDLFGQAEINLNSPQWVLEMLRRLGLSLSGTSEAELLQYRDHAVVRKLLEYRGVQKLLATFGRTLEEHLHPVTGRLHAEFRQIGTPTGRYSCSEPNLQQVPNTPEIRRCFTPPPGKKLIVADYSQIELRILAEFSQDPKMLEAFLAGHDLHRSTASLMFRVPLDQVSKEHRAVAKTINFGLVYGMGAAALAPRIETTVAEAKRLIDTYFEVFHRVHEWLRAAGDTAVSVGHSRTQSGRLWNYRFDPLDREQIATIQRLGKNTPIQGTGSDILKRAMRLVYEGLKPHDARIVNSIHDELVVEVIEHEAEEVARVVRQQMIAAGQDFVKTVPIEVDVTVSDAWMK
jgi:DNA polymerase I-like protein with 3'-5' exonuclease and polymerase domains